MWNNWTSNSQLCASVNVCSLLTSLSSGPIKEHSDQCNGLFLCCVPTCVIWFIDTRTENGGVEPARRGFISGAGDGFPGGARAARWSFLPRTPSQTSSFCGSLSLLTLHHSHSPLSQHDSWNFHCRKINNLLHWYHQRFIFVFYHTLRIITPFTIFVRIFFPNLIVLC